MLFIDKKSPPAAQRLALLAGGRAWTLPGSSINSKLENCLEIAQTPTCPVHAVLGAVLQRAFLFNDIVQFAFR